MRYLCCTLCIYSAKWYCIATGRKVKRRPLTDEEIVSHSVTFVLAGYETTANTLSYVSYLLALNPEAQQKLQHEIDSYFEQNPVSQLICCFLSLLVSYTGRFSIQCHSGD